MEVLSKTDFGRVPSNGPSEEVLRVKITNDSDKARKFAAEVGFRSVQTEVIVPILQRRLGDESSDMHLYVPG